MAWTLVYLRSARGYEAQKWPPDMPFNEKIKTSPASVHVLSPEEDRLSITELQRRYPPPVAES